MLPLLPLIIFIPFSFIIPLFLIPERHAFNISIIASLFVVILSLLAIYLGLTQGFGFLTFQQSYIQTINISLDFALTRYSNIFLVMCIIVLLSCALVAKNFIKESQRIYNLLFLVISGGVLGVFLSGNLLLFYVFWEISEVALFFIIYIFGGYDRRYAAIKFLMYSIIASLFLLIGIMLIYAGTPTHTFVIDSIISQGFSIPQSSQFLAMIMLLVAFLIKIPVFPFHHWLPDAHTEAPTTGSMLLAGILLKFGGYGLLLMFLMLPLATTYSPYLALLFGFSAVYSALVLVKQTHLKRLIAYTSIVDMGIASLGIASTNALGYAGGLYAMLSHGIVISLLFLLVGTLDEAYGTMLMGRLKGVVKNLPWLAYEFLFGVFALVGIPLTSAFIGDLLVFTSAFTTYSILGILPIIGMLIMGAFLFVVIEKSFFNSGKAIEPFHTPSPMINYSALFLIVSTIILGILPALLLSPFLT